MLLREKFNVSEKIGTARYHVREAFALFPNLMALSLALNSIKSLRVR